MNKNAEWGPKHIRQHQCLTSLILVPEWEQISTVMFQLLVERPLRRIVAVMPETFAVSDKVKYELRFRFLLTDNKNMILKENVLKENKRNRMVSISDLYTYA